MSIQEKITYYKESLDFFNDTMEKYRFLLDQGKKSDSFSRGIPARLLQGIWLSGTGMACSLHEKKFNAFSL